MECPNCQTQIEIMDDIGVCKNCGEMVEIFYKTLQDGKHKRLRPYPKKCPFCNGQAFVHQKDITERWYVICNHCGASSGLFPTESGAISAWTQREHDIKPILNLIEEWKKDVACIIQPIPDPNKKTYGDGFTKAMESCIKQLEKVLDKI